MIYYNIMLCTCSGKNTNTGHTKDLPENPSFYLPSSVNVRVYIYVCSADFLQTRFGKS